jgi:hypothetical protein
LAILQKKFENIHQKYRKLPKENLQFVRQLMLDSLGMVTNDAAARPKK